MTTNRAKDPRPRTLTCAECDAPFHAPRIGRPPLRCSDACRKAAEAHRQRQYRRGLVQDSEALAALRDTLRQAVA